jgi:hypothetical protein
VAVPAVDSSSGDRRASKANQRQQLALNALAEAILAEGQPAPEQFGLPPGVTVVLLESWKKEMMARDIIESTDPNPRTTFKRFKDGMAAKGLIGIRDGVVWAI